MALIDLANTSVIGPNNPIGAKGTGYTTGPNAEPLVNMQLANPVTGVGVFDSMTDAAGASLLGPTNPVGAKGNGSVIDPFGNIPSELTQ
jgi:hypothetical protein